MKDILFHTWMIVNYRLPKGQQDWDVLVIRESDLDKFPDKLGRVYKQIDRYAIVLSPNFNPGVL